MTIDEFVEVTDEMIKFYSMRGEKKEFSDIESKIWYQELKGLTKARFRQLTRECYRNNKFMPKLADIIQYQKTVPQKIEQETVKQEDCKFCNGSGMLPYHKRDGDNSINYFYVARCRCSNGKNLSKIIPSVEEVNINV